MKNSWTLSEPGGSYSPDQVHKSPDTTGTHAHTHTMLALVTTHNVIRFLTLQFGSVLVHFWKRNFGPFSDPVDNHSSNNLGCTCLLGLFHIVILGFAFIDTWVGSSALCVLGDL